MPYDLRSAAFYTLLAAAFFAAGMWPEIDNTFLRMAYRTALLLVFMAIIVRRDLPLSELPFIHGRRKVA